MCINLLNLSSICINLPNVSKLQMNDVTYLLSQETDYVTFSAETSDRQADLEQFCFRCRENLEDLLNKTIIKLL